MSEEVKKPEDVFEDAISKKMTYGLPDLKKFYRKFAVGGLIVAIVAHLFLIASYAFSVYLDEKKKAEEERVRKEVVLKDIQSNQQNEDEKSEAPPEIQKAEDVKVIKDLESLNPEPAAKDKAEITTLKSAEDQLKQDNTLRGKEEKEGSDMPADRLDKGQIKDVEKNVVEEQKKEVTKNTEKVFKQFEVDKAPAPVNLGSVQGSIRYPEMARQTGTEGKVSVTVLVGKDGSVEQIISISGPEVFKDEVSSKVMNLRFTPAIQQGNPVRCQVTVPFNFSLKQSGFKKESKDEDKKEESNP
jgi:TonB family protein